MPPFINTDDNTIIICTFDTDPHKCRVKSEALAIHIGTTMTCCFEAYLGDLIHNRGDNPIQPFG